jgi:hypothetical protein
MSEIKHTPLPWLTHGRYIGTANHRSAVGEVRDVNGNWGNDAKSSADAAFIVEACNSYYESRAALAAKDAEIARLRERLDIGPQGEDAIDVAESAADQLRFQISVKDAEAAKLRRERDLLRQALQRYGDKSRMGFVEPSELQQAIDDDLTQPDAKSGGVADA